MMQSRVVSEIANTERMGYITFDKIGRIENSYNVSGKKLQDKKT